MLGKVNIIMGRSRWRLGWLVIAGLMLAGFGPAQVSPSGRPPYKSKWRLGQPEDIGFDLSGLHKFAESVQGAGCVVHRGTMIYTWGPYTARADVASAGKPVLAHMVFAAAQKGLIDHLDARVAIHEPELAKINMDLEHKDQLMTWRHLLNQTANYGVTEKPGTAFNYSDSQMALLYDTLITRVYRVEHEQADEAALYPGLFDLIGQDDKPTIKGDADVTSGRLRISARDFARFGLLYLNGGIFADQQVLAPRFIRMITNSTVDADLPRTAQIAAETLPGQRTIGHNGANLEHHHGSYSHLWWVNNEINEKGERLFPALPPDAFAAIGHSGRHVLVVAPSLDLVVCWVSGLRHRPLVRFSSDGRGAVNRRLKLLMDSWTDRSG